VFLVIQENIVYIFPLIDMEATSFLLVVGLIWRQIGKSKATEIHEELVAVS